MRDTIATPEEFFNIVVIPDCEELKRSPHDIRKLFHAVISLHQLADRYFKAGTTGYPNEGAFFEALYKEKPVLKFVRDLASNAKHFPPNRTEAIQIVFLLLQLGGIMQYGVSRLGTPQHKTSH